MSHNRPDRTSRPPRRRLALGLAVAAVLASSVVPAGRPTLAAPGARQASIPSTDPIGQMEMSEIVGAISADIDRGGDPAGSDLGVESDAGNLVADAHLLGAREAGLDVDLAFMHPGSLRSDLEFEASGSEVDDGIVTFAEAFTFQPFNNTVVVLPLTGAQIRSALREQCQESDSVDPVVHLGVSAGFTYDLEITTQAGVCVSIDVSEVALDGVALVDTDTYAVAMNSFLARGAVGGFPTIADVDPAERLTGPQDLAALLTYFDDQVVVDPPGTDRVTETLTVLPTPPTALAPVRLLETRIGDEFTTTDGLFEGIDTIRAGDTVALDVRGRGGVAADASAVTLQIGAILPDGDGYLTVFPCTADERPLASSINFNGAPVVANAVTSLVGDDGTVCIYTLADTDLYVDVTGYGSPGGSPVAITPARYLDDRSFGNDGTFDGDTVPQYIGGGPLTSGDVYVLPVAGRGEVPVDAIAVNVNVVAAQPVGPGFLAVYPCEDGSEEPPRSSSVNYVSGSDFANAVTSGVGSTGNICITTPTTTNLVVDVNGYVPAGGDPDPVTPFRLVDTRIGDDFTTIDGVDQGGGPLVAGEVVEIRIAGRNGVPDDATSAHLNVAAVDTESNGYLTVFPCADDVPNASNVNYETGETVANSVQTPLTDDGTTCVFTLKSTDFILDVTGYITPIVPARPAPV